MFLFFSSYPVMLKWLVDDRDCYLYFIFPRLYYYIYYINIENI